MCPTRCHTIDAPGQKGGLAADVKRYWGRGGKKNLEDGKEKRLRYLKGWCFPLFVSQGFNTSRICAPLPPDYPTIRNGESPRNSPSLINSVTTPINPLNSTQLQHLRGRSSSVKHETMTTAQQPIPPIPQPYVRPRGSKKAQIFTAAAINAAEMHEGAVRLAEFFVSPRQWHCFPFWAKLK